VLSRFAADFRYPAAHEGHDRIISVTPGDHTSSVYSRSQIAAILQRVHDSPPIMARHFIDEEVSPRNTAIRSLSHVTRLDGYGGAGTAEDPFTLS
jgi:hypothetical protein